jgi:hypothetical protein
MQRGRPPSPKLTARQAKIFRDTIGGALVQFGHTKADLADASRRSGKPAKWVYKCFETKRPLLLEAAHTLWEVFFNTLIQNTPKENPEEEFRFLERWAHRNIGSLPRDDVPWFYFQVKPSPTALRALIEYQQYEAFAENLATVVVNELPLRDSRTIRKRRDEIKVALVKHLRRNSPKWAQRQWNAEVGFFALSRLMGQGRFEDGPFGKEYSKLRLSELGVPPE